MPNDHLYEKYLTPGSIEHVSCPSSRSTGKDIMDS